MKEVPLAFKCKNQQIVGILHFPRKKSPPLIIMCHGWGANCLGTWQGLFVEAARELSKKGFAVLRFDFRGSGNSEGNFEEQTIETMLEDLKCVLKSNSGVDADNTGLIGHSLGGKVALLKAAADKRIKCLVLWSTPALHQDVLSKAFVDEVKERRSMWFNELGCGINNRQMGSCLKHDGLKALRHLRVPVLVINGSEDTSVPASHARKMFRSANKPKRLAIIKGADHAFLNSEHKKEVFELTSAWFRRWLTTHGGE